MKAHDFRAPPDAGHGAQAGGHGHDDARMARNAARYRAEANRSA